MELNIKQRFFVVFIYSVLICGIGYYFTNDIKFLFDSNIKLNAVLITTALALILSSYISEPYFSKPIDVITRGIAIFLFLLGLNDKEHLFFYGIWKYASVGITLMALLLIFLNGFSKFQKTQQVLVDALCRISRPEIIFFLLYLDIVISFFQNERIEFPVLIGFGFLLAVNRPFVLFTKWIWNIFTFIGTKDGSNEYVGQIIGHESIDFYNVEINKDNPTRAKELKGKLVYLENKVNGIIGIILNEKILLGKKWLQVASLRDKNNELITFNIKTFSLLANQKTIYSKTNAVYFFDIENAADDLKNVIIENPTYNNFKNLMGYVWSGSTINKIRFEKLFDNILLKEKKVGEGSILQTMIGEEEVLYQIIDARTEEEKLENKDTHGFIIGTAQKLGKYNTAVHELNTAKWLPENYTPLFLMNPLHVTYDAKKFIGRLPNTNYGIPIKLPSEIVTHNTAILGILGIGKSFLTFELIQKLISDTQVKIFCIDLTNQYAPALSKYIDSTLIQEELNQTSLDNLRTNNVTGNSNNPETWGNEKNYKSTLDSEIAAFVTSPTKRIIVLNPDLHSVSKAGSSFNITHKVDLTPAEKVRYISERIFMKARELGETTDARYLIVFEEAHSLVPEWNSIANDGDKNATNGTAKVILQGRKYGLGSMIITQRTANISKSILNQCNTIFALRVFDDTGKQFLENYIGTDYSNVLPTLEERHCVVIGKALKLKQPVIIELNNAADILLPQAEASA